MSRAVAIAAAIVCLAACQHPAPPTDEDTPAQPKLVNAPRDALVIPNQYIVVLVASLTVEQVPAVARELAGAHNGDLGNPPRIYTESMNGFIVKASAADAQAISQDVRVLMVQQDNNMGAMRARPPFVSEPAVNLGNLDRIDQTDNRLSCAYRYRYTGSGVHVYVLDQAVFAGHDDFEGRADRPFDAPFVPDCTRTCTSNADCPAITGGICFQGRCVNNQRCNGHGTAVAGIIGGKTYGVAKRALLHGVCASDCTGSAVLSDFHDAIEFVARDVRRRGLPTAVVNLSYGLPAKSIQTAVRGLINKRNITVAYAGFDADLNTCTDPVTQIPKAIVVSATDTTGNRCAATRAFGQCVALYAPSEGIATTAPAMLGVNGTIDTNPTGFFGGTSGATPMVAGAAALYLEAHPGALPDAVRAAIIAEATPGVVKNAGGANCQQVPNCTPGSLPNSDCVQNRLLDTLFDLRGSPAASPSQLSFTVKEGTLSTPQLLNVTSANPDGTPGDALEFRLASDGGCCLQLPTLPSSSQCANAFVTPYSAAISVDLRNCQLTNNPCVDRVTITSINKVPTPKRVVTVNVSTSAATPAALTATPSNLAFNATQGSTLPQSARVTIGSTAAAITFGAASDMSFLTISPTSAVTPVTLTATVRPGALAPGDYGATITLTPTAVAAGPLPPALRIPVTLRVNPNMAISVSPTSLGFMAAQGTNPAPATLMITGSGAFTTSVSGSFLSVSPSSGSAPVNLAVSVASASLAPGTYTGTINVVPTGKPAIPVAVTLTVTQQGAPGPNAIVNGDFESGTAPWIFLLGATRATDGHAHAGTAYAALDFANGAAPLLKQTFTVPATPCALTFFLNVTSALTTTTNAVDNLQVYLSDANFVIHDLAAFSNLNKMALGSYVKEGGYDLSQFAGQSVTLFFRATTRDQFGVGNSVFRIDDVVVQ